MENLGGIEITQHKKYFIVIEGLDGVGKSTPSKELAISLDANLLHTPDSRLQIIRPIFDNSSITTRTAFYIACNHLVSDQTISLLETKSVVLDRYYGSTIAASYSHGLIERSDLKHKINDFSLDLLSPDLTVHLKLPESERIERIHGRDVEFSRDEKKLMINHVFRKRYLEALDSISDLTINISGLSPKEICSRIIKELYVK